MSHRNYRHKFWTSNSCDYHTYSA